MNKEVTFITKEEAAQALRKRAFTVTDPDSNDYGRTIIHSFKGSFGADWDLDAALLALSKAERVAYAWNMFGHDLAIETNSGVVRFDVKQPEKAAATASDTSLDEDTKGGHNNV